MSNIHSTKYGKYYNKIKEFYSLGYKPKKISELLKGELSSVQVSKIAYRLGLTRQSKDDSYKEIDDKAYEMYLSGMSQTKIAESLGVDQQSMTLRLKRYYNINILPDGKKHFNNTYFHNIDTKDKAYWLGFLLTDGYVSKGNDFELGIQKQDEKHLEKFKNAIESEHTIQQRFTHCGDKLFPSVRISIKDLSFVTDLKNHGCINKKSFTVELPKLDNHELYRDLIEGIFDGDGTVGIYNDYLQCSICSASEKFLKEIQEVILQDVGKLFSLRKYRNLYVLTSISEKKAYKFLKYIYSKTSLYLDRKYNKYLEFCRLRNIPQDSLDY